MSGHYEEVRARPSACAPASKPSQAPAEPLPSSVSALLQTNVQRPSANFPPQALSVYERMLKKGAEPMPATYNAAVCALARLGRLPAALALLGAAAARGVDRGVTTYAALLSACEAPGRWGRGARRGGGRACLLPLWLPLLWRLACWAASCL